MTARRLLRSHILFGSLLWTAGLLAVSSLLSTALLHRHAEVVLRIAHGSLMGIAAVACIVAGLALVRKGLSPFAELRSRLWAVRDGRAARVEGRYPAEVQPLVDDLNALLDERERRVNRALARAGDLAHGLKTPLAVLAQEAERAASTGHTDLGATIGQQVERMRGQIDYHLAQARAAASGATPGVRCLVRESAEGLARTLLRLHADRGLAIAVTVPADHAVRVRREDLDEMLGNLLDNACKWAVSQVTVSSEEDEAGFTIVVDDDGPGIDPSMRDAVLQRGVRADEAAAGSGFGLAIVRDLAALHGGTIVLDRSPAGGAGARLHLPKA